jgi:NAD(P)-dependent dehydrogenase (short-subunit alcohol dehydrogenase family)
MVLTSRSGPAADGVAEVAADLALTGVSVDVVACDVARRQQAAGLLDRIALDGGRLDAVFHAAGVGQATALHDTTVAELAEVAEAKVAGAAHLDALTRDSGLERFVVFSSVSSTWGSGLQPAYGAANAYLDALVEQRRAQGLAGTSVAWGLWGGGGMAEGAPGEALQRLGVGEMDPDRAIAALAQVVDAGEAAVTVADVDWDRFAPVFTLRRPSPLIA